MRYFDLVQFWQSGINEDIKDSGGSLDNEPSIWWNSDENCYEYSTHSAKGRYKLYSDGILKFEGFRNSFQDGTKYFWFQNQGHLVLFTKNLFIDEVFPFEVTLISWDSSQPGRIPPLLANL